MSAPQRSAALCNIIQAALAAGATLLPCLHAALATPWSFGVMTDTQWVSSDLPPTDVANNPNSVAVSIINQVNQRFIDAGVSFVIQVGDLTDHYSYNSIDQRAAAATALYNAGIGFFPLRGNHDGSGLAYPAPGDDSLAYLRAVFPQMTGTDNRFGATNFQVNAASGSYAFDYNNTRFMLLDQYQGGGVLGGDLHTAIANQLPWIGDTLSALSDPDPAVLNKLVFGHQNLLFTGTCASLFSCNSDSAQSQSAENAFMSELEQNDVPLYISGHQHLYQRSLVTSPDGKSHIIEVIGGSDSNKFYSSVGIDPNRQIFMQDLYKIGYTIFKINEDNIQVLYYA